MVLADDRTHETIFGEEQRTFLRMVVRAVPNRGIPYENYYAMSFDFSCADDLAVRRFLRIAGAPFMTTALRDRHGYNRSSAPSEIGADVTEQLPGGTITAEIPYIRSDLDSVHVEYTSRILGEDKIEWRSMTVRNGRAAAPPTLEKEGLELMSWPSRGHAGTTRRAGRRKASTHDASDRVRLLGGDRPPSCEREPVLVRCFRFMRRW